MHRSGSVCTSRFMLPRNAGFSHEGSIHIHACISHTFAYVCVCVFVYVHIHINPYGSVFLSGKSKIEIGQLKIQCAINQPNSSGQYKTTVYNSVSKIKQLQHRGNAECGCSNKATQRYLKFIHVNSEIKSDRCVGCMQADRLVLWRKASLAGRQHCMTPVSCCEPEFLNLYCATLCQVDLPACSRVSAPKCCGSLLQWAMMLFMVRGVRDQGVSTSLL